MLTWHSNLQFWVMLAPDRLENRYWCAYGTEDPTKQSMVSITCEINPPHFGVNRLCAGLFISDSSGSVYLAHSGKVGGGRAGRDICRRISELNSILVDPQESFCISENVLD